MNWYKKVLPQSRSGWERCLSVIIMALIVVLFVGFLCFVSSTNGCGDSIRFTDSKVAYIESPGYPSASYGEEEDCLWQIKVPDNHDVQVEYEYLNLRTPAEADSCSGFDRLEFLALPTMRVFATACNQQTAQPQSISRKAFQIHFFTASLPQETTSSDIAGFRIKLTAVPYWDVYCGSDRFNVTLLTSRLELSQRYPYEMYLLGGNPSCTATVHADRLTFASTYDDCGTTFVKGQGYTNVIVAQPKQLSVGTRPTIKIPVRCAFQAEGEVISQKYDSSLFVDPFAGWDYDARRASRLGQRARETVMKPVEGYVELGVVMNLFNNDEFLSDEQPDPWRQEAIYIDLAIPNPPQAVTIRAQNCWLSTSSNATAAVPRFEFLQNGCPAGEEPAERLPSGPTRDRITITHVELPDAMLGVQYVHCTFRICHQTDPDAGTNCDRTCVPPTGRIRGVVRNAINRRPVANVQVRAQSRGNGSPVVTRTGSDGAYRLDLPADIEFSLDFQSPDHHSALIQNVRIGAKEERVIQPLLYISSAVSGLGISSGIVRNCLTGQPEPRVRVTVRSGIDEKRLNPVTENLVTGTDGLWTFMAPTGHYTVSFSKPSLIDTFITVAVLGGQTTSDQDTAMSPVMSNDMLRAVARWTSGPIDLDAHMTGPNGQGGRFHVYFADLGQSRYKPYTNLDHDASQIGPETITVQQENRSGVYRFSLHDHTNRFSETSEELSTAIPEIDVYRGYELLSKFYAPVGRGTLWTVFEMEDGVIRASNKLTHIPNGNPYEIV